MAIPVIDLSQSVLGFRQGETWAFQPFAYNAPSSWVSSPLPDGVSLNTTTGRIEGAAAVPGFYVVGLRAINTDGPSAVARFTIAIEPTSDILNSPERALFINLDTGGVSTTLGGPAGGSGQADAPLLRVKHGDDALFRVQFTRAGVLQDLAVTAMRFSLKEFEPDPILLSSTAWRRTGYAPTPTWKIYVPILGDALDGAISNYEADDGTHFPGLAEIEWISDAPDVPFIGAASLTSTTLSFRVDIIRDLTPPAA